MNTLIVVAILLMLIIDLYWLIFAPPKTWWEKLKWDIQLPRLRREIEDSEDLSLLAPRLWMADSPRNRLLGRFWHLPKNHKLLILAGLLLANCVLWMTLIILIFGSGSLVVLILTLSIQFFAALLPLLYLLIVRN
jgi:hypothetical protein